MIYSNYFVLKKNQIQNLIREKCRNGLKKFQLTTELKLVKPKVDDDSQETITIYTNTTLQPVYFYGITDNDYYQLIEQSTSALFIFALQGSGWIFPKLKTFLLNIHPILLFGVALTWHFQMNFKVVGHYPIFGTLKMRIDVYIVIRPLTTCTQSYPWLKQVHGAAKQTQALIILHIILWQKRMQATCGCQCRFMNLNNSKNSTKSKSMCLYWRRKMCYLSESPNSLVTLSWIYYCCQMEVLITTY